MSNLQIDNNLAKEMKKFGFFGDYILAKRLQPNRGYVAYTRGPIGSFINYSFNWNLTPQGGKFWLNIYDKFTH